MRAPLLDNDKNDVARGRKQLAQDSHDDMSRIEGYVRARGGARIEPDERGEPFLGRSSITDPGSPKSYNPGLKWLGDNTWWIEHVAQLQDSKIII